MQNGRPSGMQNGPPWMRGQMQQQGRRDAPDGQAEWAHQKQQSNGEHRGGPDRPRRGAGEGDGPGRGGPDGPRRGAGEGDGPGRGRPDGPQRGAGEVDGPGRGNR